MRHHDELRPLLRAPVDLHKKSQLPLRGERRLRLVQKIDPVRSEAVLRQCQKALAVRPLMEPEGRVIAVRVVHLPGGHIVETLRAQKVSIPGAPHAPRQPDRITQFRVRIICRKVVVSCPAFRIEPVRDRDRLQQRRFPATVLSHEKGDRLPERDLLNAVDRGDIPQIAFAADPVPVDHDAVYKKWIPHRILHFSLLRPGHLASGRAI